MMMMLMVGTRYQTWPWTAVHLSMHQSSPGSMNACARLKSTRRKELGIWNRTLTEYFAGKRVPKLLRSIGIPKSNLPGTVPKFVKEFVAVKTDRRRTVSVHAFRERLLHGHGVNDNLILPAFFRFLTSGSAPSRSAKKKPRPNFYPQISHLVERVTAAWGDHNPAGWYPDARRMQRQIILHVGPTNSGKTHQALMKLKESASGIYCGPLRLLAREIYSRMNEEWNKPCSLVTGEEILPPTISSQGITAPHISATVEMADLSTLFDVAVIDEIQMIGDFGRGWAWTQAFLGLQAHEIHLCGESTVIPLIKDLVKTTGDRLKINRYQRLSPLTMDRESLQCKWANIRPGDCVVVFDRRGIFRTRSLIEQATGLRCAVIYGALPPEVRAEQAKLFNQGDYQVLVASDAIGMGLNLKIGRIIFKTLEKFNGVQNIELSMPVVKQIAGRAGRFGHERESSPARILSASSSSSASKKRQAGLVTTFHDGSMRAVKYALDCPMSDLPPIEQAGLLPTRDAIERLSKLMSKRQLVDFVTLFEMAQKVDGLYFLCEMSTMKKLAELLRDRPIPIMDQFTMAQAPVRANSLCMLESFSDMADAIQIHARSSTDTVEPVKEKSSAQMWAEIFKHRKATIYDLLPFRRYVRPAADMIDIDPFQFIEETRKSSRPLDTNFQDPLTMTEGFHHVTTLYMWMYYRFPDVFGYLETAEKLKTILEQVIGDELAALSQEKARPQKLALPNGPDSQVNLDSLLDALKSMQGNPDTK